MRAIKGLASVYRKEQRFDEAEELINKAIDLQPGNWNSINDLGGLLFNLGRYADAAHAYQRVVYLDPECLPHARSGRARRAWPERCPG